MSVIIFILVLSFLVVIHEMGHLLAARWANMKVSEFGLGYPPRILKLFSWKETVFSWNWIPFGGFVSIAGEDGYLDEDKPKPGSFASAPAWKQLIVITAGVAINFIFGVLVFAVLFSYFGIPQFQGAKITQIAEDSPASSAGLQVDNYILGFQLLKDNDTDDNFIVSGNDSIVNFVSQYRGELVGVIVSDSYCQLDQKSCQQSAQLREIYLRTTEETPSGQGALGITFQSVIEYQRYDWYLMPFYGISQGMKDAFELGIKIVQLVGQLPGQLFQNKSSDVEVSGPIGIAYHVQKQDIFSTGWVSILTFAAMLSINLAVINILPIPALDGGRAVFIILRMFVSSSKIKKVEYHTNWLGYVLLLTLIIGITFKDIWMIVSSSFGIN